MNFVLITVSLFVSVFINFSYIAILTLSSGYLPGHSNTIFSGVLELNLFTLGLPIIIPSVILFLVLRSYEKKRTQSSYKSYVTLCIIILFIATTVLVVAAENLIRNFDTERIEELEELLDPLTTNTNDVLVCEKMIQDPTNYYASKDCYASACKNIVDPNSRKSCFAPICKQIEINDLRRGAKYIDPEWNRECGFGLQYEKI